MKRKIFISINIPDKVKKRLVSITQKWQDLPVKWVKEANFFYWQEYKHKNFSFIFFYSLDPGSSPG